MRRRFAVGLLLWTSLGCRSHDARPTREQCLRVSEHVADLVIADSVASPDGLWDVVHGEPGETGIPPAITKDGFKAWLDSPEGKTWLVQRRGNVLAATQQAVDGCVQKASEAQVSCLLAARSKADVDACDANAR